MQKLNKTFSMSACLFLAAVLLSQQSTDAFVHQATHRSPAIVGVAPSLTKNSRNAMLFSTPGDDSSTESDDSSSDLLETIAAVSVTETKPATTAKAAEESTSYPIDLPSPILLASSMLLAIVGTGSGFDLASPTPRFGFGITFSMATVGLTLSVGLFYASIMKAKAETEADDQEYMRGK